ncbi:AAA family ATPase [Lacticaseibacillus jixiensis]|uniref:AAA family ATPase n=1 Tax=Lacticaseibacillus jixiensis TaxID=3231926 RepID=UPI0036F2E4D1
MRLEHLAMQNFGPYRDEAVDFSAFETTPLFLISGKTGSGKTTIFDALVFALYGTTTGGERSGAEMRANFASVDEPTVVRLRFTHGGKTYLLTRAPEQLLAKKRGSGLTNVPAKVALKILVDGQEVEELTKVQTVRTRIQSLLQLDADQFRQMVLLPQGKFRQFLDANSDAKGALLRQLFGTDLYARWQAALNTAAKKETAAIQQQQARLETLASQFDYGELTPPNQATIADKVTLMHQRLAALAAQLKAQQAQAAAAKAAYSAANTAYTTGATLAAAFERQTNAQAALAELKAEAPALAQAQQQLTDLTWAHEQAPLVQTIANNQATHEQLTKQISQTKADLLRATAALGAATDAAAALQQQAPRIAAARETLSGLAAVQTQLERQHQAQVALAKIQTAASAAKAQASTATKAVEAIQQQVLANHQAQQELAQADQSAALQQLETLTAGLSATAKTWQQATRRAKALLAKRPKLQDSVTAAQQAAAQTQAAYTKLHDAHLNNQIAALVAQLSADAPCPVCGSLEHPHPAQVQATQAVSPSALRQADTKRQQAAQQLADAQAELTQLDENVAQFNQDEQQAAALIQAQAQEQAQASAQATLDALRAQLIALRQTVAEQRQQQSDLMQAQQTLQAQLTKAQQNQQAATQAAQAQALAQAAAQAQLDAATSALPQDAPTLDELLVQQQQLSEQISAYEQAIADNSEAQNQARTQHTRLQTTLQDHQQQQSGLAKTLQQDQARLALALTKHHSNAQTLAALLADQAQIPLLQQQLQAAAQAKAKQSALLEEATRQIANRSQPDLEQLAAARAQADQAATQAAQRVTQLQGQSQQATQLAETIETELAANQTALKSAVSLQNLAAIVNGNNRQKLSLERYVLRAYLQQVLVVANKRLQGLSDGRYQLQLHTDPGSYHNDSGLEIDVYDDQVGEIRSVHTLSGGESFIAALALALALGEVIQQTAGGISIDALFIDEGFGSLDSASLDTALEALEAIDGQSRMIGIISHVESLQTGIPDQLRVVPTGAGDSHIQVVHLGQ